MGTILRPFGSYDPQSVPTIRNRSLLSVGHSVPTIRNRSLLSLGHSVPRIRNRSLLSLGHSVPTICNRSLLSLGHSILRSAIGLYILYFFSFSTFSAPCLYFTMLG